MRWRLHTQTERPYLMSEQDDFWDIVGEQWSEEDLEAFRCAADDWEDYVDEMSAYNALIEVSTSGGPYDHIISAEMRMSRPDAMFLVSLWRDRYMHPTIHERLESFMDQLMSRIQRRADPPGGSYVLSIITDPLGGGDFAIPVELEPEFQEPPGEHPPLGD
jgi:hypothetical protein